MYTDKTQKVHVSLTKQVTKDNNHVMFDGSEEVQSISKLEFKEVSIPLERVLVELKNGRCIGQFYLIDPYRRKKGSHPSHDWRGTSWIGVDIDDSIVAPKTMHNELRWTPTFTMTTQSHMKPGKRNRYRLFYFFRLDIENYEGLKKVADRIAGDVRNPASTMAIPMNVRWNHRGQSMFQVRFMRAIQKRLQQELRSLTNRKKVKGVKRH